MSPIDRIVYQGTIPDSFFKIPEKIYEKSPVKPTEEPEAIRSFFAMEAIQHDIILYTDHEHFRLAGIFPKAEPAAYFGFWESVADSELHEQAFRLLENDAREKGRVNLTGPINFSTFQANRLRVGDSPSWGMFDKEPVNPVYYPDLLSAIGFQEKLTYETRLISRKNLPALFANKNEFVKAISQIPFDFITLNLENWKLYEHDIFQLMHIIFKENPFYKAISYKQFQIIYSHRFAEKLCPHSSVLIRDQASGQLVAICMCQPNYHALYPSVKEPDFARDFEKLNHKTLMAKTFGVHPDFRRQGLLNYMGAYGMLTLIDGIYEDVLLCLMRSDNYSAHFSNNIPYESAKYALYEKILS
ncbi:MAG TPA: hypothetical protein VK541_19600 [Pedobacter sp.]|uniref:hypothetical protein n=1 Tax=Pedobacter sp. TaxID=1411316 RepID=UPI002CEA313D|nr:hypothetical protein [Pedobacter sp.]HMI04703.1 hypothetical protein [Pedobacter sp.]